MARSMSTREQAFAQTHFETQTRSLRRWPGLLHSWTNRQIKQAFKVAMATNGHDRQFVAA
jgi:hypothetical protein